MRNGMTASSRFEGLVEESDTRMIARRRGFKSPFCHKFDCGFGQIT